MSYTIAHNIEDDEIKRTGDIKINENLNFADMLIPEKILEGLHRSGFKTPSPIQLRAIPLGRSGLDLIVQAKSGTGKTLVFSVILLESYSSEINSPQSLILTPTREIAVQIVDVLRNIASAIPDFKVDNFIGGLNIIEDRSKIQNCKCIVGTPGRILQLIQTQVLKTETIKILVFDEADKLIETSYLADINKIVKLLHNRRQMIATSATIDNQLKSILSSYMRNPTNVTPRREIPVLLGIKQFGYEISDDVNQLKEMQTKIAEMKKIFRSITFKQCLVFSNSQSRAESYCNLLNNDDWPTEVISGAHDQKTRLNILHKLKEFKFRILITTDLMSRGIDAENINLVINLDIPHSGPTYLHRIGRAGRYGSYGIAITFFKKGYETEKFQKLLGTIGGSKMSVLKFPNSDNIPDLWSFEDIDGERKKFGEIFGTAGENTDSAESKMCDDSHDELTKRLTENLNLLEITKRLVDDPTKKAAATDMLSIFDEYNESNSIKNYDDSASSPLASPPTTANYNIPIDYENLLCEYKKMNDTDNEDDDGCDADGQKSDSMITNDRTENNFDEPDDSDSDKSNFGSSSSRSITEKIDDNTQNSTSSDQEDDMLHIDDEYCDGIGGGIFYRKLPDQEEYRLTFWRRQYQYQMLAIQQYVEMCRKNKI